MQDHRICVPSWFTWLITAYKFGPPCPGMCGLKIIVMLFVALKLWPQLIPKRPPQPKKVQSQDLENRARAGHGQTNKVLKETCWVQTVCGLCRNFFYACPPAVRKRQFMSFQVLNPYSINKHYVAGAVCCALVLQAVPKVRRQISKLVQLVHLATGHVSSFSFPGRQIQRILQVHGLSCPGMFYPTDPTSVANSWESSQKDTLDSDDMRRQWFCFTKEHQSFPPVWPWQVWTCSAEEEQLLQAVMCISWHLIASI